MSRRTGKSRAVLCAALLAACSLVPSGQESGPAIQGTPDVERRALLVGIEAYPEDRGWPRLRGPRGDVELFRKALIERAGFSPEKTSPKRCFPTGIFLERTLMTLRDRCPRTT